VVDALVDVDYKSQQFRGSDRRRPRWIACCCGAIT
jgi:hypothetical protein